MKAVSDMSEEWGVSFLSPEARKRYLERLEARKNGQHVLAKAKARSVMADPGTAKQRKQEKAIGGGV